MNTIKHLLYLTTIFAYLPTPIYAMNTSDLMNLRKTIIKKCRNIYSPKDTYVFSNNAQTIQLAPHEQTTKSLTTQGLIGSTGTILYAKSKDNHQIIGLSHYAPYALDKQKKQLYYQTKMLTKKLDLQILKLLIVLPSFSYDPENYPCLYPVNKHIACCNTIYNALHQTALYGMNNDFLLQTIYVEYAMSYYKDNSDTTIQVILNNNNSSYCTIFGLQNQGFKLE